MDTWHQTNFFNLLTPRAVHPVAEYRFPIAPQQLWNLLTSTQQQQVWQTLVQMGLELIATLPPEAHDDPA